MERAGDSIGEERHWIFSGWLDKSNIFNISIYSIYEYNIFNISEKSTILKLIAEAL